MTAGNAYIYKISSCLAVGSYIVRHEIIALHSAGEYSSAQLYSSRHQIQVTGSGTSSKPTSKISILGMYARLKIQESRMICILRRLIRFLARSYSHAKALLMLMRRRQSVIQDCERLIDGTIL